MNPSNGEVAYAAGTVVVVYNSRRNRQTRYLRATQAVACAAFSPCGRYVAAGEAGRRPAVFVWSADGGGECLGVLREHVFGVGHVGFGGGAHAALLVSLGFTMDGKLNVWDWRSGRLLAHARLSQRVCALTVCPATGVFVTAGERHMRFWALAEVALDAAAGCVAAPAPAPARRPAGVPA